ncbi:MAG: L-serine ammonia-lyase, partial [Bryobacteraceae bacterium]|nr:L-serine ammonia-lyase [Bryobacteraceae bacterium]
HGTDRAVLLGLQGHTPEEIEPDAVEPEIERILVSRTLQLQGLHQIGFNVDEDLRFFENEVLPEHSNGMRFTAYDQTGSQLLSEIWYSTGGGAIRRAGEKGPPVRAQVPYPYSSGQELLERATVARLSVPELMLENEKAWRAETEILTGIDRIWSAMQNCADRGLRISGTLPGGLGVQRRAPALAARLLSARSPNAMDALDWLNAYALAVNEENAAGGRVVTAPTNGAAGLLPAVVHHYVKFEHGSTTQGIHRFFLAAAAIGVLYKENASISGAEVGCQGEIGVACSMAAAGLVAALEGTNEQIEHAAEIGMEHNLGMTCDPIGGLVQVPCIERNAISAVKAVNAARLAMLDTGTHIISLDKVIRTMYETGLDMSTRYKETSLAGLALHAIKC